MLDIQNTNQKNNFLQKVSEEKILSEEKNSGELRIFNAQEWKHFISEVNKQFDEGQAVDFEKATHNARYLTMLDKSIQQGKEGKIISFTEEEWENFVNEQELH